MTIVAFLQLEAEGERQKATVRREMARAWRTYPSPDKRLPGRGPDRRSPNELADIDERIANKHDAKAEHLAATADAHITLAAALTRALRDSGCDGDLCNRQWHEDARAALRQAEVDL